MSAVPRPIPIVVGDPHDNEMAWLVLRVIERGHEDLHYAMCIGYQWRDHLAHALNHAIHKMRLEVGVRHGTWICHVLPADRWTGRCPQPPPVAPMIRQREPRRWVSVYPDDRWDITPAALADLYVPY